MRDSVRQAAAAHRLLRNIGMRELVTVEKIRTVHRHPDLPGATVSIDEVRGAGVFVETEVLRSTADGSAEMVEEIERSLGIVGHPTVSLPYRDLVMNAANDRRCAGPARRPAGAPPAAA
ncbi:CYTH domain-containing protein [Streptomyces sp. NPDC088124]|uniref:CYTH domain-containing protein n=1 Tax=Streptomyces sp. NPDC088124 TaxID=3154654 RepID=UPI003444AE92